MLTPVQISQILEKLIDHKTLNLFLNIMHTVFFMLNLIIMAALRSRRGHYIFVLWFVFLSISSLAARRCLRFLVTSYVCMYNNFTVYQSNFKLRQSSYLIYNFR